MLKFQKGSCEQNEVYLLDKESFLKLMNNNYSIYCYRYLCSVIIIPCWLENERIFLTEIPHFTINTEFFLKYEKETKL